MLMLGAATGAQRLPGGSCTKAPASIQHIRRDPTMTDIPYRYGREAAMGYRILAEVVMVTHLVFLGYLTFGGFLAWRWPWSFWPHLLVASWGIIAVTIGVECPLTYAEDRLRELAGQPGLPTGFIDHYIEGVIYPEHYTIGIRWLMAAMVAISWTGLVIRRRRPNRHRYRRIDASL